MSAVMAAGQREASWSAPGRSASTRSSSREEPVSSSLALQKWQRYRRSPCRPAAVAESGRRAALLLLLPQTKWETLGQ
jgi:hypothetical protein